MNVSHETFCRLKRYQQLLELWQKKVNLVSDSSLSETWERHVMDSYQLHDYLPLSGHTLIDLGSGAGFPGLVLAIARPEILVTLVESDLKKCVFLENVSRETGAPVTVLCSRIEDLAMQADVVTARGLAPLTRLFDYAFPLLKKESVGLFLKGKEADQEIKEAQKKWEFTLEIYPSITDPKGKVLKINHLKRRSHD